MELREWLIILGLVLVVVIVIDGARRYRRQKQIPRLDEGGDTNEPEKRGKALDWELPNGGARVVESARVAPPESNVSLFERRGMKTKLPFARTERAVEASRHEPKLALAEGEEEAYLSTSASPLAMADYRPPEHGEEEVGERFETSAQEASRVEAATPPEQREALEWEEREFEDEEHRPEHHGAEREEQRETSAREGFQRFEGEDEHVDDPRYEGLSEILFRRPMDGVARLQEAAAERREQRAIKREEARVRRLEERARRAEEKARRREEKERQAEELRLRREEERKKREAQEREERERLAQQQAHAAPARGEDGRGLPDLDRFGAGQEFDDDDDPLFAPRRRAEEEYQRAGDAGFEPEFEPRDDRDRREYRRGRDQDEYQDAGQDDAYRGGRSAESQRDDDRRFAGEPRDYDRAERGRAPAPELHPVIERALRHRVAGSDALHVLGDAEEVLVINVVARDGERFHGIDLLQLLLACGLRYGPEGGLFHRFETESEQSPLQFSVVNALKPGSFPIEEMETFSTRGVTFLMPLPSADDSSGAFAAMFETAKVLVRNLHGELRDEQQSVMTAQTVEFTRQRVHEFERRMRLYRQSR
ncbi:cell division protein ZipA C-terminal FtsZ-binding domain-containing protein [Halotalea alkalilenta]|uniref:cell division protein ZipA C-terminal FtsZ-binding domain-containing protein n=1 Tax=Halotalea alkalilenta TaxID=376489 RepID=UPI000489CB05|nr:cell division protein ZipA C-terminal FtsZ-binding domain-containing protein [Halotalea alkalilenta]